MKASTVQPRQTYEPGRHFSSYLAIQALLIHAREMLRSMFPGQGAAQAQYEGVPTTPQQKTYETPRVKKLTEEQARLLLLGHASIGNQAANDLVELVFPDPEKIE